MRITFLGTGTSQGVPVIACRCPVCTSSDLRDNRLRTSLLIEWNDFTCVIDTGPDFRQQMLRARVTRLNAVLFTHEHKDHTAGLDDVRAFNFLQKKPMDVYASPRVQEALKREFAYVFAEKKYPGVPQLNLHNLSHEVPFALAGRTIVPIEARHYRLPVLGFRIGGLAYLTDANSIEEAEKEKLMDAEVLVLNALRREQHISHFNLDEAVELALETRAKRVYFTHISHLMGLHEETTRQLPPHIDLAYDGLVVDL